MNNLGQANDIMYSIEEGLLDRKHVDNYVLMTLYVLFVAYLSYCMKTMEGRFSKLNKLHRNKFSLLRLHTWKIIPSKEILHFFSERIRSTGSTHYATIGLYYVIWIIYFVNYFFSFISSEL